MLLFLDCSCHFLVTRADDVCCSLLLSQLLLPPLPFGGVIALRLVDLVATLELTLWLSWPPVLCLIL